MIAIELFFLTFFGVAFLIVGFILLIMALWSYSQQWRQWRHRSLTIRTGETDRVLKPSWTQRLRYQWGNVQKTGMAILWPPVVAGGVGAFLAHDWLLTPFFLAVGLLGGIYMSRRKGLAKRRQSAEIIEDIMETFIDLFTVHNAIFEPLVMALASLPPEQANGEVPDAIREAAHTYDVSQDLDQALQVLQKLNYPSLTRFSALLSSAGQKSSDELLLLMREQLERTKEQGKMRSRTRMIFASLRITLLVMAGAIMAVTIGILLIPIWRTYYTAGLGQRLLYMGMTLFAFGVIAYFDYAFMAMEEQIL